MGTDPAMHQAIQALTALHSTQGDPAVRKQADEWLISFQQTKAAWLVCDSMLSCSELPAEHKTMFHFFAAQTMRAKVQFDFYELQQGDCVQLRDSIFGHIDRFRSPTDEHHAIHTMLAVALADLAIQMDSGWPDAVPSLFARFGQNTDSYSTLLEILRQLPEENMNLKLMTDSDKRKNSRERLQCSAQQVVQFLLSLQCPTISAKRKVLECFLSWIKFTEFNGAEIARNPILPECFKFVAEGGELAEPATDIAVEILRMCSCNLNDFQDAIQTILSMLPPLRAKLETLLACGVESALDSDHDGVLRICRIFVETGECLIPLIMGQIANEEVASILMVILKCTDLPSEEISCISFDFWNRLRREIESHQRSVPETTPATETFAAMYKELLNVVIRRCEFQGEDPFEADDDLLTYRHSLLRLAKDCACVLTPNRALEHVLTSLTHNQGRGVPAQEAHFYVLTMIGSMAEVREDSVLWALIEGLPGIMSAPIDEKDLAGKVAHFAKKTAVDLLGQLARWLRTRPELARRALSMISATLMQQTPAGAPEDAVKRVRMVQESAAVAFKDVSQFCRDVMKDAVQDLIGLYQQTLHTLPFKLGFYVVQGISSVVAVLEQDEPFRHSLEQMVRPLVEGLKSDRENPTVLCEILDRLTTIIRLMEVKSGTTRAIHMGTLVETGFWPVSRQTLEWHPGDSKVVEKSCRLVKHSMRCVQDHFKNLVPQVAQTLVGAFEQHQHSSYLYTAEILAEAYGRDPEVLPVLQTLFNTLSAHGMRTLAKHSDALVHHTELVEDYYGMFDRYLRFAPSIVLEAQTLRPTLELLLKAVFIQQKDTIEAVVGFIERVLKLVEIEQGKDPGRRLQAHVQPIGQDLAIALFRVIAFVPPQDVQAMMPSIFDHIQKAFPAEFAVWLQAAFKVLPPSAASPAEVQRMGERLVSGRCGIRDFEDVFADLCYRCEQVTLRNRSTSGASAVRR